MFPSSAARNYARAFVATAAGKADLTALAADFHAWVEALRQHPGLRAAIDNPALAVAAREGVAAAVLAPAGASPVLVAIVKLVIRNGHARGFDAIDRAFARAAAAARGVVHAEVAWSRTGDAEEAARLQAALAQALGREVEIEATVDPGLIGGFIVRAGDLVFDGSLRRQLERMRSELGGR